MAQGPGRMPFWPRRSPSVSESLSSASNQRGARHSARQKLSAVAQTFLIDAMADAVRDVPFARHFELGETSRRSKQGLYRNKLVAVAMDEQDRRARHDPGYKLFGICFRRRNDQQSGIADHPERRRASPQPHMQRHHG